MSSFRFAAIIGRGVAVDTGLGLLLRASSLAVTVVVARTLTEVEFGAVTVALTIFGISETITNLSLETALVRREALPREVVDVAWTLSLLRALFLGAVLYAMAPLVGGLWGGHESVATYLRVLLLGTVVGSLANTHVVRFQRELRFGLSLLLTNGRILLGTIATLVWLLASGDAFALVLGPAVGNACYSVFTWVFISPRPRPRLSKDIARELIEFGRWLVAHSIFVYLFFTLDNLYVASVLGLAAVGAYGLAWRVTNTIVTFLTRSLSGMLVPAYASLRANPQEMNRAALGALRIAACAGALVASGLLLLAPELFAVISGAGAWKDAVPVARALTLLAFTRVTNNVLGPLFHAAGLPRPLALLSGLQLLLLPFALVLGNSLGGLTGVALGVSVVTAIIALVNGVLAARIFALPLQGQLFAVFPPLVLCIPAVLVAYTSIQWLESPWVRLGVGGPTLVASFIVAWETFRRVAPASWGGYPSLVLPVAAGIRNWLRRPMMGDGA